MCPDFCVCQNLNEEQWCDLFVDIWETVFTLEEEAELHIALNLEDL